MSLKFFFGSQKGLKLFLQTGILALILLFIHSSSAFSQLEELELITLDTPDQVMVFRDYPDHAAVVISSKLTGLRFESNVEIVANLSTPNTGEYKLIIPPFRQSITVNMDGYRQLRFTVPVSSPRQVVYYEIRPLEEEEDLIPIVLSVSPLDASIFIDEQGVDQNNVIRLTKGAHQVRIEKEGYKTITEEITVNEESFRFDYQLNQLQLERVTISTVPTDARIEINNVERGSSDWQDFLFPGEYFVRISKNGYRTIQQQITVSENPSNSSTINSFNFNLQSFAGQINLTLNPPNARVYLNRQPYTGQNPINLPPGAYLLSVESDGYIPYTENIVITENSVVNKNVELQQIVGNLRLTIQPIRASVSLINSSGQTVQQWQGANLLNNLPTGTYTVRATAADYQQYSETVVIRENQTSVVDVSMTAMSVIEQQNLARQRQLEEDRQRIAAAEEQRQQDQEAREKRRGFFRHPDMGGLNLHYSTFTSDAGAFSSNVDDQYGIGLGFFRYSRYKAFYLDFVYNSYTLTEGAGEEFELYDTILSYNLSTSFVPTLPVGPFMVGFGAGLDYTQYEGETDVEYQYYYTLDAFYSFTLALKPQNWAIGFLFDTRGSFDVGLSDTYTPWSQVKFSLIWAYNQ